MVKSKYFNNSCMESVQYRLLNLKIFQIDNVCRVWITVKSDKN